MKANNCPKTINYSSDDDTTDSNTSDDDTTIIMDNSKIFTKNYDGFTTTLNNNTPFIQFLIKRRTDSSGGYCHIAAFVPKLEGGQQSLIHGPKGKGKDRYWRELI